MGRGREIGREREIEGEREIKKDRYIARYRKREIEERELRHEWSRKIRSHVPWSHFVSKATDA